jgi:hypothetical protein
MVTKHVCLDSGSARWGAIVFANWAICRVADRRMHNCKVEM